MNSVSVDLLETNILVVDDTPSNLRVLATMLTKRGYNVRKALSGEMALTACKNLLPDLILLDIMMPDMDGYEVCQRLKADEETSKIPVIFLSALNDVVDKVKAFSVGGADFITKPFQFEEVLARVKSQLALRAAEVKILKLNAELEERVQERTSQLAERTRQLEIANQELIQEISERKQLQSQLLYLALHDPLTNLPNRVLFSDRLEAALKRAKEQAGYKFAVLFLDCDRFKNINDSLGHLAGDELLAALAGRLQKTISSNDTLARLGGDEFAVLLEKIVGIEQAVQVAERILMALSTPFQLSRYEVFINASIGIALSELEDNKAEYLLRDADTAMYRAKALGKGRYHVFDREMHQQAFQFLQLENDLRRAVERQEFVVCYQPIISLKTGKISGFESLVRWQHPVRGFVSPAEFIPIAEEIGLITDIDTWVLQESCRQLCVWQESMNDGLTVSVNLSARLFSQHDLIAKIDQIIQQYPVNPRNLKMEITESAIMENRESAKAILKQLKVREIQLSIDDFGTGYSSLSYLQDFPVDALKIDQSFVRRLNGNIENSGLVPAIVSIAHNLGMSAVAEGVEPPEQLAQLKHLDCDFGQGYLFSRPLEKDSASALLAAVPQW